MWRHTELVYERSPYKGATHQVLLYLAHRAHHKTHRLEVSNERIARDCRIDPRSVTRAIKTLTEDGSITLVLKGSAPGKASIWSMGEAFMTVDTMSSVGQETVDTVSTVDNKTMDIESGTIDMVSPTVDILSETIDTVSTKGNKKVLKGSGKGKRENARSRVADAPSPDLPAGATSFAARFKAMTGYWVGFNQQDYLQERLGEEPDWKLLGEVFKDWVTRGNNPRNLRGIFDWYDQRRVYPGWQPYQQNGHTSAGPSKAPKTFTQIRQDNTLAAAQRLMEKYANEPA